ncbi:MAG: nucleotidyltransferase [Proteobacteria bacterium]|nr:MAG: nucleotidyltransferase [Pseudomonadota bacterium]
MPRSIADGFNDFLPKLTASSYESATAASHRSSIKTRLEADFGSLKRFTRIGSFGNGTSISGFSDTDYLAVLRTDQLTLTSNASLTKVRTSLADRFPNTGVHVNCPAVVCPFGTSKSETVEVVPADYIKEENGHPVYEIPDCANGWMKASPDAHNAYVKRVDEKYDYKVKPLIRFIKAWKFYRSVPISSFYLELKVARFAETQSSILYEYDVRTILQQLSSNELSALQDPTGVSGLIQPCKSDADYRDALSKTQTAATRASNARDESDKKNILEAFYWWRLLYNDEFPSYYY